MTIFGVIEITKGWKAQISDLVQEELYVQAAKLYRAKTGKGLKEALVYINKVCRKQGKPIKFPSANPQGNIPIIEK